ncbi:MAG: alpha/beta fold hydrolase [Cyanobacteria bacterium J06627_28]
MVFKISRNHSRIGSRTWSLVAGVCLGGLLPLMLPRPSVAAERVTLTYGFLEVSTSVTSLRTYAETGEASEDIAPYIAFLSAEQQTQLRQALQARRDIDAVEMSQFLYSALGDNILRSAGDIIQTQGRRDGTRALRGALVLAANHPEGLSLLGVVEEFATNNVRIDAQRAFRVFEGVVGLLEDTENAIAAIERQQQPISVLSPSIPALEQLSQPGPYGVVMETFSLVDRERARTLPTDIYLPTGLPEGTAAPVVVFSHGLAGDRKGFIELSEHLASHGYAVAALDHPGSNRDRLEALFEGRAREVADPTEFSDRPRDVSFLLDELTRQNETNPRLDTRLDLERIGIIGHSFGGYTALALAGAQLDFANLQANCDSNAFIYNAANPSMVLQCSALEAPAQFSIPLQDERIDTVITLNPVTSSLFGPDGFSQIAIPSLIVTGSEDPLAPALLEHIEPFTWLDQSDDYLALIEGGSHLYEPLDVEGAQSTRLGRTLVSSDIPLAMDYVKAMSLGFLQAQLNQNPVYQNALNDASIVQIGEPSLPLFIVNTLTEEMLQPITTEASPTQQLAPTELTPSEDQNNGAAQ